MQPRNVLVFRDYLLSISETFVYNQSLRLRRFTAFFLGSKGPPSGGIILPRDRTYLINKGGLKGRAREAAFKLFGHLPSDVVAFVRCVDPLLIHAHFGPDGALILPIARRLGLPLVVSFHGSDATMRDEYMRRSYPSQRLYLKRRCHLRRVVDRVIVPSLFVKKRVIEQGFSEQKISLIHHGVDVKIFSPDPSRVEWGQVLFVGRLIPLKGLNFLISALYHVRKRIPQVRLTVIGDGPMRAQYEAQARRLLGKGFLFLGAQPHHVVKDFMSRAYLFAMPSITMPSGQAEAFGVVFLEAQAMGVPVVSFATGGIPEVVAHGETGFLAKEGNVGQLAFYIERLLESPELRERLGRAGRRRVERMFDLEVQNAKLERLYEEVLETARAGEKRGRNV